MRGHEWMLTDQEQTLRVLALADGPSPPPGACVNCHSSMVPIVDALGDGTDLGPGLNAAGWAETNAMSCTDGRRSTVTAWLRWPVSTAGRDSPR